MKSDNYEASGRINKEGKLCIYNIEKLNQWSKDWMNRNVIIQIQVIDDSSRKQIVYFEKHIFPQFKKAMIATGHYLNDDHLFLILAKECPFMVEDGEVKTIYEMTQNRLNMVIEWIKWYSAENLQQFIND